MQRHSHQTKIVSWAEKKNIDKRETAENEMWEEKPRGPKKTRREKSDKIIIKDIFMSAINVHHQRSTSDP